MFFNLHCQLLAESVRSRHCWWTEPVHYLSRPHELDLGSPTTELSLQGSLRLHLHTDLDSLCIDQLCDGLQVFKESEAGQKLLEKSWMMAGRNPHHFPNFIITTRQKDSQKHLNKGKCLRD